MIPVLALIETGLAGAWARRTAFVMAAGAGLALSGAVQAAPSAPEAPRPPARVFVAAPGTVHYDDGVVSSSITTTDDDGRSWKLMTSGDTTRAWHDGKELAPEQITRDGSVFVLRGSDGAEQRFYASGRGMMSAEAPPAVMVGISLGGVSPALRYHLGLGEDAKAIFVENVVPGLPAAEAGVRRFDVITSIAGSDGADGTTLREILKNKQPGDALPMVVIAGGEIQVKTLKLQAFDADKLAFADDASGNDFFGNAFGFDDAGAVWAERAGVSARAAAERAEEMARRLSDRARLETDRLVLRGRAFDQEFPALVERLGGDAERHLDELEARLERLEETLEARFESMLDRLERSLDDRERQSKEE